MKFPESGATAKQICDQHPGMTEDEVLSKIAGLIQRGEAHMKGDLILPGKPRPGRPPAEQKRVPITIRLPSELVDWLREKGNYTKFIEDLVRIERIKAKQHDWRFSKKQAL